MNREFDIYIPLKGFRYSGVITDFLSEINIVRFSNFQSLESLKQSVSSDEWNDAKSTPYWLFFDWNDENPNSASDIMNLVLLSLWLVKPNRVESRLKFKIGKNGSSGETGRSRILDRMQWNRGEENEPFTEADIQTAFGYYTAFKKVYRSRLRLSNAMILTLNGCWSYFWQASLISHSAAIEAILTCSTKPGLTKRLAVSYACLTENEQVTRDKAFEEFVELYSIRSDAIHGRVHNLDKQERLPTLSRLQSLLRTLWRKVLSDCRYMEILDKTDEEREVFFNEIQNGYCAPVR